MQKMMGYMRRAIQDYGMIENGDRIAVGVSGGKDSVGLLCGLARMRDFLGVSFEVVGITIDPGFGGKPGSFDSIKELCAQLGVEYSIKPSNIADVVFNIREEKNPCSLCAKLRRGALHDEALRLGCSKLALGHNMDDAVETFLMNLMQGGHIGCFAPVTWLSRKQITVIRPLIYIPEREVRNAVTRSGLPIVESGCPVNGKTVREDTKLFLERLEQEYPGIRQRILGAMIRGDIDGWGRGNIGR